MSGGKGVQGVIKAGTYKHYHAVTGMLDNFRQHGYQLSRKPLSHTPIKKSSFLTGGHLKSGQHIEVTFLQYYGTQENGYDIILNLIQNAIFS